METEHAWLDSAIRFERMRACACGFAGRRLQPLGYVEMHWHRTTESNREPSALEAAALPVELARYGWWVRMDSNHRVPWETALQAAAIGLSATHPLMAPRARFERATSGFVDRRS